MKKFLAIAALLFAVGSLFSAPPCDCGCADGGVCTCPACPVGVSALLPDGTTVSVPIQVPKLSDVVADDPVWFACRICVDHGDSSACGSGTPVHCENGKTTILTNAHVVPAADRDRKITVVVAGRSYTARYVEGSPVARLGPGSIRVDGPDLALLEIDYEIGHVALADEAPPAGAQTWQFGYGGVQPNRPCTSKSGVVTVNKITETTLTTTIAGVSGDSGSGVFNTRGELVGVTWGGSTTTGHCAVEVTTVRTFLGRPVLAKLFPKLTARLAARRVAKEVAKLPAPSQVPPAVARLGPVDPKLAAPAVPMPPIATAPRDYRACLAHVAKGGKCILAVDVRQIPLGAYSATASEIDGVCKPGIYECSRNEKGEAVFVPFRVPQPMQGYQLPGYGAPRTCNGPNCR